MRIEGGEGEGGATGLGNPADPHSRFSSKYGTYNTVNVATFKTVNGTYKTVMAYMTHIRQSRAHKIQSRLAHIS